MREGKKLIVTSVLNDMHLPHKLTMQCLFEKIETLS